MKKTAKSLVLVKAVITNLTEENASRIIGGWPTGKTRPSPLPPPKK